jgi:hypothetical protein
MIWKTRITEKLVLPHWGRSSSKVEKYFQKFRFKKFKLACEKPKGKSNIRVIIGGGDGTVLWVVGEMIKYSVDFEKCPIGILPFGTGNDFSRCLGWGGKIGLFSKWNSLNRDS